MICSHCGTDNKDDAIKCVQCGEPLKPAADKTEEKKSNASSRIRKISVEREETRRLEKGKKSRKASVDGRTGELPDLSRHSRGAAIEDTLDLTNFHLDEIELKEESLDDSDFDGEPIFLEGDVTDGDTLPTPEPLPPSGGSSDGFRRKKRWLWILIGLVAAALLIVLCSVLISSRKGSAGYADLILEGNRYFQEGDYTAARECYEDAIRANPKGTESYLGLADIYEAQGDLTQGAEILRQGAQATGNSDLLEQAKALEAGRPRETETTPASDTAGTETDAPEVLWETAPLDEETSTDNSDVAWVLEPCVVADNILPVIGCAQGDDVYSLDVSMIIRDGQAGLIRDDGTVVVEPVYRYILLCGGKLYGILPDGSSVGFNSDYTADPQSPHSHTGAVYSYLWDTNDQVIYRIVRQGEETYVEETACEIGENVLVPVISGTREDYTIEGALYAVAGSGGLVTDFIYESAASVSTEGFLGVCRGGLWGFCNGEGVEVIPCQYEGSNALNLSDSEGISYVQGPAYSYSDGLVAVKKAGIWGYLDMSGAVAAPFIFQEARPSHGQGAWVKYEDQWGRISLGQ